MGFEKNTRTKKPEFNKNGTPRTHGEMQLMNFKLEPEYIDYVVSDARDSGVPKSKLLRDIVHYYYREVDGKKDNQSIKQKYLRNVQAKKRIAINNVFDPAAKDMQRLVTELNRIGNNINQIAKKTNQGYVNVSLRNDVEECRKVYEYTVDIMIKISDLLKELKEEY